MEWTCAGAVATKSTPRRPHPSHALRPFYEGRSRQAPSQSVRRVSTDGQLLTIVWQLGLRVSRTCRSVECDPRGMSIRRCASIPEEAGWWHVPRVGQQIRASSQVVWRWRPGYIRARSTRAPADHESANDGRGLPPSTQRQLDPATTPRDVSAAPGPERSCSGVARISAVAMRCAG